MTEVQLDEGLPPESGSNRVVRPRYAVRQQRALGQRIKHVSCRFFVGTLKSLGARLRVRRPARRSVRRGRQPLEQRGFSHLESRQRPCGSPGEYPRPRFHRLVGIRRRGWGGAMHVAGRR
jgi:hypothetical protein